MKRLIALAVVLILVLSMTAVAEETKVDLYAKYPQYNIADKDSGAELSALIVYNSANFTSFEDWWWWQFMEEVTGVKIVPTLVEKSVYNEQLAIILSSGDIPDIIWHGFTNSDIVKYGMQENIFAVLNDYAFNAELMPNLNKLFEESPDTKAASICSDGNIYGLPVFTNKNSNLSARQVWETTWLEQAGIDWKSIATLDDLYNALKAAVAVDYNGNGIADEIGWSSFWGSDGKNGMSELVKNIEVAYGIASNDGILAIDTKNNVGGLAVTMDGYYETLQFLSRLYAEGLLDNDLFSQEETDVVAKMSNNQFAFSTYSNPGYYPIFVEMDVQAFVQEKLGWQIPFVANAEDTPIAPVAAQNSMNTVVVTTACKDLELAAKWLDACYDPLFSLYYLAGAEFGSEDDIYNCGFNYDMDGHGFHWDLGKAATGRDSMNDWEYLCNINSIEGRGNSGTTDSYYINGTEEGLERFDNQYMHGISWTDGYDARVAQYHISFYPSLYYNEDQLSIIDDLTSDVETFIIENTAKFISGEQELNEESWSNFLAQFDKIGGAELNAMYADAYATYLANANA